MDESVWFNRINFLLKQVDPDTPSGVSAFLADVITSPRPDDPPTDESGLCAEDKLPADLDKMRRGGLDGNVADLFPADLFRCLLEMRTRS